MRRGGSLGLREACGRQGRRLRHLRRLRRLLRRTGAADCALAMSGGGGAGGGQNSDLMASLEDALQEFNRRIRTLPDDIARSNQSSIEKVLGRR